MPATRIWTLMARKLNNEIAAEELQELELLLRQNADEHYAVEIVTEQWKKKPASDTASLQKSFEKVWDAIEMQELARLSSSIPKEPTYFNQHSVKKYMWLSVAAASIIGISIFIVAKFVTHPAEKFTATPLNEISTKYGSKTKLLLPDSTQVWLNSGSTLTYDNSYGQQIREVKLSGEAYFDVVKNIEKPFIIHTEKMDIKVLGTAFNVKCYPGEKHVETSLIRGSVEVTIKNRQSEKILLKPNEKLVISDNNYLTLLPKTTQKNNKTKADLPTEALVSITPVTYNKTDNDIVETAWVYNKLIFNMETFEELALRMERWYGVRINFKNEQLRHNRITGTFENETVQQALDALQYTTRFKYTITKNEITIFK